MSTLHVNCGCNLGIFRFFFIYVKNTGFLSDKRYDFPVKSRYLQLIFSFIGNEKYRVFTEVIHVKL